MVDQEKRRRYQEKIVEDWQGMVEQNNRLYAENGRLEAEVDRLTAALDAREREVERLREALEGARRDVLAVYENTDEGSMSHMNYYQASAAFRARLQVALWTMNRALAASPRRAATGEGDAFQCEVCAWARETFPHQTVDSILAHLAEEVAELRASRDPEEAADCLIALCSFAGLRGVSLLAEGRRKLAINRGRTWAPPDADGISRHVRDEDAAATGEDE